VTGPSLTSPLWWQSIDGNRGVVGYRGTLASAGAPALRLRFGRDGWSSSGAPEETDLERTVDGHWSAELPGLGGHLAVDLAVTDGTDWDNNDGADYRLWIGLEPIDSHLHASHSGDGRFGARSLHIAMRSAGIRSGVISWRNNRFVDRLTAAAPNLHPLVWIAPGRTSVRSVERRLAAGHVGLKLHPTLDRFQGDDWRLHPFIAAAERAGVPVTVHSGPGDADPDHIRRLGERFPSVPIVLYHTYLGPHEGRRRAVRHAQELSNLYLETSWCTWPEAKRLVDEVGPDRVLFGSDAAADGHCHYRPPFPNVEGQETYNDGMIALARSLGPEAAEQVFAGNTRRLFGL
jgi:predicted TIM-barrel fold metal-dependent hydrolase